MVWYEAARLMHGRPEPFQGDFYENLLLHYRPAWDGWYGEEENEVGHRIQNVLDLITKLSQAQFCFISNFFTTVNKC